ncbi:two-component regulator propeller domain-containing protein [uncultured Bacteroides sp.]|uniref:hybrid sensor histidine kinase/response regulator transcription factor n=1 Tax=uncultured Bacteroides sp. TaxID=162156 RepID=UPI002AA6B000|nr:two-component regulator propeller domain-containing protein [uncultured Bacteroides sp.]
MKKLFGIEISCMLLILFATPEKTYASNVVKYISNVNGLTNNSVNCILEDSEHTIWVGTWDGLNAYNGRDILTFRYNKNNPSSISNNIIRQLIEQNQDIWITTDNGINKLNKRTHQVTRYYLQTGNQIPNQEKSFILGKSSQGTIICLVKGIGFFSYNTTSDAFKLINTKLANKVKDFLINQSDQILFLLTDGKVVHLNNKELTSDIQASDLQKLNINTTVNKIFLSGNRFILNSKNTLSILHPDFTVDKEIKPDIQKNISEVKLMGKQLYIGFIEGSCIRYNLEKDDYSYWEELPRQLSVFTLYPGSQNILWIGTDGQGLIQLYHYNSLFTTIHTTHPVRSFCEDSKGRILVGTKGSGIKLLDTSARQLTDFLSEADGLISNSVYALKRNSANDLFIGTEGAGINILDGKAGKLGKLKIPEKYPVFKAVYSIYFTNNDSLLWLGTSGYGLIKMNISKENGTYKVNGFRQYTSGDKNKSLNNDVVYAVTSSTDNRSLWFGTRGGGLSQIDMLDNSIKETDSNILLTNNDILCLQREGNDIWIGTSYGLNRLEISGYEHKLVQYADEKLNNKTIHGILKDANGNIWISTNQGLSCLNVKSNKINNYTLNDGLQNDEFSDGAYFKDSNDMLYFGGVSGLNYFDPKNIHLRNFNAPLTLSNLKIYNTPQDLNKRISAGVLKLSYEERFVTFTFLTKDFINNENCEYAYRLKNHSDEWVEMGNNPNIIFTQLPPGKYVLEVKSSNGDKVWGHNIYRLTIRVGYPWWLSMPALLIYGLLCVIILFVTRSVIRNRIRMSRQIFITETEKRHEQKIYESKLNFFANVAHEFFTPLTLIYTPAQHLLEQVKMDADTRKYLEIIKNNAERMQKLISELMDFTKIKPGEVNLKPEKIEVKALIEYASGNYVDILKENRIEFKVDMHDVGELFSDRNALEKIIFNLLSNAFKYTSKGGYIHLEVVQQSNRDNLLQLTIRNSCKGLTEQQMAEIFNKYKIFDMPRPGNSVSNGIGLNLTKNLTELLGGEIKVSSELGKYVEFSVAIPPLSAVANNLLTDANEPSVKEMEQVKELKPRQDTVILIVEDENNIRELLKDVLSDYIIQEAGDGIEALSYIERNHPDLIISDIIMPRMDGFSLISHLKSDPKTSYIPIINISAKVSIEDQINAYNHGADAYITKPFHPKHVISAIENLLSRQALLKNYFNSSLSSIKLKDGIVLYPEDEKLIKDVTEFVKDNIDDEKLTPATIAEFVGVSKATLYRKFKELSDKTPSEFVRNLRLDHAARLLRTSKLTVSEIMFQSGFSNKSYFYREFLKLFGQSPKDYRNQ